MIYNVHMSFVVASSIYELLGVMLCAHSVVHAHCERVKIFTYVVHILL